VLVSLAGNQALLGPYNRSRSSIAARCPFSKEDPVSIASRAFLHVRAGRRHRLLARARSRCLWPVAATWLVASTAWAVQPPGNVRYTRPAAKVRPVEDPKAEILAARQQASELPSGPSSAGAPGERHRKDIELAAIDDQLRLLEALLREAGPDDKDYPDYLFRYADLHLDRKAIFEDQAGSLYEKIHDAEQAGKPEAAKRLAAKQRELQKKARAASEAAVKAYALLVQSRRWAG
jgi:hypothetical protein